MKQGWVMMKKICFKDYSLEIDVDGFINIIGSRNSGKTYLLKMMMDVKSCYMRLYVCQTVRIFDLRIQYNLHL